jgi:hypothetical protein
MIQSEERKEHGGPPTQAHWCSDVWSYGIGPAEQQIATGHHSHCHHYCIEHDKKYVFPDLFVHDIMVLIMIAYETQCKGTNNN